jgi:anti-sigma28 factor (negative regulator of flagellin synthesis)
MRINASLINPATPGVAPAPSSPQSRKASPAISPVPVDQVRISTLAAQLAPDPARLAQLQAAHDAGTYHISPSQIARSIINAHLKV